MNVPLDWLAGSLFSSLACFLIASSAASRIFCFSGAKRPAACPSNAAVTASLVASPTIPSASFSPRSRPSSYAIASAVPTPADARNSGSAICPPPFAKSPTIPRTGTPWVSSSALVASFPILLNSFGNFAIAPNGKNVEPNSTKSRTLSFTVGLRPIDKLSAVLGAVNANAIRCHVGFFSYASARLTRSCSFSISFFTLRTSSSVGL